jgi:hypothetical protein
MPDPQPTTARKIVAWVLVILVVLGVWKFVDYRNQPPKLIPYVVWAP